MAPESAPWRPSPIIVLSAALHAVALLLTLWHRPWWPWMLAAVVADHLLLLAVGLTPRSALLGPNWTRLPAASRLRCQVALTIDDGPDPAVTPQVLRILAEHGARATFFCIGARAERHPELVRACVQAGHAVENHSFHHHYWFCLLGPRALARDIERAQGTLARITGIRPRFFRPPAGLRSPLLEPVLQRRGLRLASWTRRGLDTLSGDAERVLARLTRHLGAGDILLLHDGHAARGRRGEPVVLEVLPRLLRLLHSQGLQAVTLREWLPETTHGARPLAGGTMADP